MTVDDYENSDIARKGATAEEIFRAEFADRIVEDITAQHIDADFVVWNADRSGTVRVDVKYEGRAAETGNYVCELAGLCFDEGQGVHRPHKGWAFGGPEDVIAFYEPDPPQFVMVLRRALCRLAFEARDIRMVPSNAHKWIVVALIPRLELLAAPYTRVVKVAPPDGQYGGNDGFVRPEEIRF